MKYFLCSIFFLLTSNIFSGFAAGTLVKMRHGYKSIEEIQIGDMICTATTSGWSGLSKVSAITSYSMPKAVLILMDDDAIIASPMQKFFDPRTKTWCKAQSLYLMDYFISLGGGFVCIDRTYDMGCEIEFFDIRLEDEHTFFVTKKNIVVHNFPLVFIGLSWAIGGGGIAFQGLHAGICILGLWLGTKLLKRGSKLICKPLVIGKTLDGIANDDWYEVFASNDGSGVCLGNYTCFQAELISCTDQCYKKNYEDKKPSIKDVKKELDDQKKNGGGAGPEKDPKDPKNCPKGVIGYFTKVLKHVFQEAEGHLKDLPENRKLLLDMASDAKNYLGTDMYGNAWYGKILKNGKQLWAWARDNLIRDGGINKIPRAFNAKTGFCNQLPPK